ncbi:hypothetical protein [Acidovorax sp. SD340]|uniref:hypothetical protein n=1 Tax=Acidovorax sp. SD340 TaxID=1690268 RepID=UPI0006DC1DFE|nr:hypothetical protein [Acidovorax sp. SD340]KQB59320.1 hypothetical protein AE621_10350 [Acidovorax sp. SD340]MBO1007151.1 hypothetical protein [Acidovorax sp. SD340]
MALSELDMMNLWAKQLSGYKSQWERLFGFGYAIEAEVRKDDEALIRQMLEALTAPVDGEALHALHMSAIAAARARLFDSGLSTLTERGAKAWAGVDPQKLREGKAP